MVEDKENNKVEGNEFGDKADGKSANHANSQETKSEFGDFKEIKEEEKKLVPKSKPVKKGGKPQKGRYGRSAWNQEGEGPIRVKMPRDGELIGVVVQRLGGNKMDIKATDGKSRNSRVPGRFRRKFWLRPGDFVIIMPWESDDDKADIIFQYRGGQVNQLKKRGLVDGLKDDF